MYQCGTIKVLKRRAQELKELNSLMACRKKLSVSLCGAGPDAALPSAGQQWAEQFVTGVTGVSNNPVGLLLTPLGVEVLHGHSSVQAMC